jgi:hypothetical protein
VEEQVEQVSNRLRLALILRSSKTQQHQKFLQIYTHKAANCSLANFAASFHRSRMIELSTAASLQTSLSTSTIANPHPKTSHSNKTSPAAASL